MSSNAADFYQAVAVQAAGEGPAAVPEIGRSPWTAMCSPVGRPQERRNGSWAAEILDATYLAAACAVRPSLLSCSQ